MDLVISGVLHSISLKKSSSWGHIEGRSSPSGCPSLLVGVVQQKKRLHDQARHLPTGNQHPGLGELNWSHWGHIEGRSSPSGCPSLLVGVVQQKKRLHDQARHLPTGNQHPGLGELNWSHRTSMLSVQVSSHTDLHLPFPGLAWPVQILTRPKLI